MRHFATFVQYAVLLVVFHLAAMGEALSPDATRLAELVQQGQVAAMAHDWKTVEERFRAAVSLVPTNGYYFNMLGFSLEHLHRYDDAVTCFQQALAIDPEDSYASQQLGMCKYRQKSYREAAIAFENCLRYKPDDERSHYWLGITHYQMGHFAEAAASLRESARLNPKDVEAHYWCGLSLFRAGSYAEAIGFLEAAKALKRGSLRTSLPLVGCYLVTGKYERIQPLFPRLFVMGGIASFLAYVTGLWLLLGRTAKVQTDPTPGIVFSLAWIVLFIESQIGLLLPASVLSKLGLTVTPVTIILLGGIPILLAAGYGFARQPWGTVFRWPLKLKFDRVMTQAFGLMIGMGLLDTAYGWIISQWAGKPMDQESIPILKYAVSTGPAVAFLAIVLIGPIVEEILFRGLLWEALQPRSGTRAAVIVTSLVFAVVHLQVVGFVPVFLVGMVLCWARWKSGSLGLPMVLHCLNNGFFFGWMLLSRSHV